VPQENVLARLGGDEFTVLPDHLAPRRGRRESGAAHSGRAGVTFPHRGHEIFTSASIGIAVFPDDGGDVETLLKNADTAMYTAKEEGRRTTNSSPRP